MPKTKKNSISIRRNRFDKRNCRFENEEYACLKFKKNFKSIHDEQNKFTNFDRSYGTRTYKELRKIYKEFKDGVNILDKYFIGDELILDKVKIGRLRRIFYNISGIGFTNVDIIKNVWKYKHKTIPRLQLYIYKEPNKELNLILIDIFHLGIYAQKNGTYHEKNIYLQNKDNHVDIKDITK